MTRGPLRGKIPPSQTPPRPAPTQPRPPALRYIPLAIFALWAIFLMQDGMKAASRVDTIPYSDFLKLVDEGKVERAAIAKDRVLAELKAPLPSGKKEIVSPRPEDPRLITRLERAGVRFAAEHESGFWRDIGAWLLPVLIMVAFWSFVLRGMGNMAKGPMLGLGKSKARIYSEQGVGTHFADVAGIQEAKAELQELVNYLRDPGKFNRLGGRVPKGVLLVGPPGTGKTLVARAVAGEAGVPFLSINGSEFVEMFVGLGAARVRDLFTEARAHAPCIIFIDELDALGKMRGVAGITGSNDEKEQTLNQLLAEIDGFDATKGVVLLAATNRPEVLDPALLRSGRFDRQIVIDRPDKAGRREILGVHLLGIKAAPALDLGEIAGITAGFSGADLANLVNEAAIVATRRDAESVESADFMQAFERMVAGLERKTRVMSAEEKRRVAYHEMGHAAVGFEVPFGETIHKVSIVPRGMGALGYTMRMPTEDRYLLGRRELEARLEMLLGGRASEEVFLGEISTGAADDLDKASELARSMITRYGMSAALGLATYERTLQPFLADTGGAAPAVLAKRDFSEATAKAIDQEIRSLLDDAHSRALATVRRNAAFVEAGVERLLLQETLTEAEIRGLWRAHAAQAGGPVLVASA